MPDIESGWRSIPSTPKPNMPKAIEEDFEKFKLEISKAHMYWSHFRALFTESQQTVEILNESAGGFFRHIQEIYFDYAILHIGRMLDPAQTKVNKVPKDNFTLEKLHKELKSCLDQNSYDQANLIFSTIRKKYAASFKHWRNRTIAHMDYETIKDPAQLPAINVLMVNQLLEKLAEYMNVIDGYFHNTEFAYDGFIERRGVQDLIATLRMGLRYEELVQSHDIAFDDLDHSKWQLRQDN